MGIIIFDFYANTILKRGINDMNFLWTDSLTQPCFPSLDGDKQTDVLIIGGGMAGVLCAYFLERNNVNYILV